MKVESHLGGIQLGELLGGETCKRVSLCHGRIRLPNAVREGFVRWMFTVRHA